MWKFVPVIIGLFTIAQFIAVTWATCVWETHTGVKVMMIVFSVVGIIASVLLIVGGIKLSRKLLIPYLCVMSAYLLTFVIVFIGILDGGQEDLLEAHWGIVKGNTLLLLLISLYWWILPDDQTDYEPLLSVD